MVARGVVSVRTGGVARGLISRRTIVSSFAWVARAMTSAREIPSALDTALAVAIDAVCAARAAAWARIASPSARTFRVTTKSAPRLANSNAVLRSDTSETAQRQGPRHNGPRAGNSARSQNRYSGLNASYFNRVCESYAGITQPTGYSARVRAVCTVAKSFDTNTQRDRNGFSARTT